MIRTTLAALAICAATATTAAAQDTQSYRYLGKNELGAAMVGSNVTGAQNDRWVNIVLAATTVRPTGADNYIFRFNANCTNRTFRYAYMEAYLGSDKIGEQEGTTDFSTAEPNSLNENALDYACNGTLASGDNTVTNGIAAARTYAFGKARGN
ncbi:hypothetical protein P1X14_15385 [Sphingomonas sp. AOB5]|uniref:hypothetical protein n=1 Tax=Sphingomonas sp. AOB5 TaxID=3034017 RepID=UPI0023F61BE1|nr:hypothetical protein [Sphingomonas sp. AOB5]MDF7776639.1 hypothetical protein [Sphingomonas sp. AOB5]